MAVSTRAHIVDPEVGARRTVCGTDVPVVVWRWITEARQPPTLWTPAQVWLDTDEETSRQPSCGRCASIATRRDLVVVAVRAWHARGTDEQEQA